MGSPAASESAAPAAIAADEPRSEVRSRGSDDGDASPDRQGERATSDSTGVPFTYWDGDVQRTVWLQPQTGPGGDAGDASGGGAAGASGSSTLGGGDAADEPVFRSSSGREMRLPGGVTLVLDPDWTQGQVDAFLDGNGIARNRVSPLNWIENGFFVETAPGFASLTLANALASQGGVVLSSPNWASELVAE